MKNYFNDWSDMKKYGINFLTGEADAYGMRLLFDVNEQGKELLERFFGGTIKIEPKSNWNSYVNGEPAVGSIMIPVELFRPIARFILFYVHNSYAAVEMGHGIYEMTQTELEQELTYSPQLKFFRNYAYKADPSVSVKDRNVHQMSGRIV